MSTELDRRGREMMKWSWKSGVEIPPPDAVIEAQVPASNRWVLVTRTLTGVAILCQGPLCTDAVASDVLLISSDTYVEFRIRDNRELIYRTGQAIVLIGG